MNVFLQEIQRQLSCLGPEKQRLTERLLHLTQNNSSEHSHSPEAINE